LIIYSAGLGYMQVPLADVVLVVRDLLLPGLQGDAIDPVARTVVGDVRLPRIFGSVLVGGMLALSGAVFQAILRNPLADPYTLGISSGAAFGASLVFVVQLIGLQLPQIASVPIFAFFGAVATLAAVLSLAAGDSRLSSSSLILSGVIVAAILSAAIGFLKFIADEHVGVIIFWLMGSLSGVSWSNIALLLAGGVTGLLVSLYFSRDLNVVCTGERSAMTLGVNAVRLRMILLVTCSLMTAFCVAVAGIIGFVGLIVPHMLRQVIGPDNRWLLILSFIGGGLLLLLADTLTRAVLPAEVPIGVLTALLGGPFFCYIFKRKQKHGSTGF
jgi:iron complex transport system permease protein